MSDNMLTAKLDQALRAGGVVFQSVSIGSGSDRSTWRVVPASAQAAAQPIIDAFEPPTPNTLLEDDAEARLVMDKRFKAVMEALWEAIPAPALTKAQVKQRAKQIYKNGNGS